MPGNSSESTTGTGAYDLLGVPLPHSLADHGRTPGRAQLTKTVDRAQPETRGHAPAGQLPGRSDRKFRPDIQGLRSVAVILVVLYHCGVPGVPGGYVGVDVFFVISGFLITRQLVVERRRTGRIALRAFYARRIKRLLPSASAVIATTVIAFRLWGPPLQSAGVAKDAIFTAFYAMNFRLAAEQVDYQNVDGPVSPFQHFWSLAVEEQFYILWPVIIVLVGIAWRRRFGTALGRILAAAVVSSLVVSIVVTRENPISAYFGLNTRAWELGVGALLAVGTSTVLRVVSRPVAAVAGWLGLGLIVTAAVTFTAGTPFPGSAAAIPVAGAALVVLSGLTDGARGVERVLRPPVMQFVGRVSYAWYLWHWPVLVLAPTVLQAQVPWWENVGLSVLSFGVAVVSNILIEQPTARRQLRPLRWIALGVAMSALVAGTAAVVAALPPIGLDGGGRAATLDLSDADGSALTKLLDGADLSDAVPANLTPTLATARDDVPPTTFDGCHADFLVTTEPPCVYGDAAGSRTVVLFGDSHAQQWFGALDTLAKSAGWRLISWTKAACPPADLLLMSDQLHRPYTECPDWRRDTLRKIADLHPDLVIASASDALPPGNYPNTAWSAKTVDYLSALAAGSDRVVYLADIPRPTSNVPVCLAGNVQTARRCHFTRSSMTSGGSTQSQLPTRHATVTAAARRAGIPVVDPTDWFCGTTGCPVIVANTLVYRDATHVTQAYSRALSPVVARALATVVPWIPQR